MLWDLCVLGFAQAVPKFLCGSPCLSWPGAWGDEASCVSQGLAALSCGGRFDPELSGYGICSFAPGKVTYGFKTPQPYWVGGPREEEVRRTH